MSRPSQGLPALLGPPLLIMVGAWLIRLVLAGEYVTHVKPVMAVPLLATGALLVGLGGHTLLSERISAAPAHHQRLPQLAWLLAVPVLVGCLVGPATLGAFTAARSTEPPPAPSGPYLPLPPGDPLAIPLLSYAERSAYDGGAGLAGRRFVLLGFVSHDTAGDWYLTRLRMRCCAADAQPVKVRIVGAADQPDDRWLTVTGSYLPADGNRIAQLRAEVIEPAPVPREPYVTG